MKRNEIKSNKFSRDGGGRVGAGYGRVTVNRKENTGRGSSKRTGNKEKIGKC